MWQPRQTLTNNSSPLISTNLKPVLSAGVDAGTPALCARAVNDDSEGTTAIAMARAVQSLQFACVIWTTSADFGLDDIALRFDHAVMQPGDGIEGR
jgi:hypothetical protein